MLKVASRARAMYILRFDYHLNYVLTATRYMLDKAVSLNRLLTEMLVSFIYILYSYAFKT